METVIPKEKENCKCEIVKYKTSDSQYNCLKDFDVNIYSCLKNDRITVILPNEFIVKISRSKKLVILRQKTNEKSIVTPDGTRYEYFNVPNDSHQNINIIYPGQQYQRNLQGIEKPLTIRSDEDFVRTDKNRTKFCFLGFTVKQSLFSLNGIRITIRVYTKDSNKSMRIRICPEHQSFFVVHLLENKINRCTSSEFLCEHL
uniref:Uncharacterized protein n=1 Tax=Panagrolaimus davidi TaxID=227884 RepID=A0A914PKE1_9BILA